MSANVRRITLAAGCVFLTLLLAPVADAFFPDGGFNQFNQLRYVVWPVQEFDTNNDGKITTGEGLEIFIEGGKSGYTPEEIQVVKDSFQVWQDVPTSYASFRFAGIVQDPIFVATEASPDFLSVIALQVTETDDTGEEVEPDPSDVLVPGLDFPVLGLTLPLYTIEDEILVVSGEAYTISAGTLIDVDIVINAAGVRPGIEGGDALYDLKSILVHEIGHLLGMSHTPLNNLREVFDTEDAETSIDLVENEVFWYSGASGEGKYIGATPTMFPVYFSVEKDSGYRVGGTQDLAPDDISGISFLYPRGSQSNFFSIKAEARTQTREGMGLPSIPIPGGHVVAWVDTDDNPDTARVPLFSTMTALYEPVTDLQMEGYFELFGIWKQIEVPGASGTLFNPSYTLTFNPLNGTGYDRQAPVTPYEVADFDSIQGTQGRGAQQRDDYITAFSSEVFHEVENVLDISNKDAGTPLVWSYEMNTVISADTQRTLPEMLPNRKPMFGDPNDVCPLNVISGSGTGSSTTTTAALLRQFRDNMLLQTAVGTAVVDLYYQMSPVLARYLIGHEAAFKGARALGHGVDWALAHLLYIFGAVMTLFFAGGLAWRRYRKVFVAGAVLLLALGWANDAFSDIAHVTTPEMAAGADDIITGTVTSVESRWTRGGRIYTDVIVEVQDTAKGNLNKSSNISLSVIGGRVGGFVYQPSEMPTFSKDEQVLLYLRRLANDRLVLYGGARGKFVVVTDEKTGKACVQGDSIVVKQALIEDKKDMAEDSAKDNAAAETQDGLIPLDVYMEYLRKVVRKKENTPK